MASAATLAGILATLAFTYLPSAHSSNGVWLTNTSDLGAGTSGPIPDIFGSAAGEGSSTHLGTLSSTDSEGTILVDNYQNTFAASTSDSFDDAQGFTTGPLRYRLTGVELASTDAQPDAEVSVVISEPTGAGHPGATLYQLESPSNLAGRPFFKAPENAILRPNTKYLVRIDVTAESVGWEFTTDKTETTLGISGWSIEDHFWTSSGVMAGMDWLKDETRVYALTVRGVEPDDDFGETSWTAGRLAFSRYTGKSPTVNGFIDNATDTDWFDTSLSFDAGGRYRIDVEPVLLTNDDDIGVRAFYLDNRHLSSGVVSLDVESVSDPPDGFVSWHFVAERNYGPFVEVYADNGTTGEYAVRVVYDPVRVWTGTEILRGDLPHDDTTWATLVVDGAESDQGVYHYYEDHDWFAVELEEDTNYVFLAFAAGAYSSYIDPAIKLYDDEGTELESGYISHGDSATTSISITRQVATGEGGTYYISVSNAELWDDPVKMANVGITEPLVLFSPFLGTRYYVLAATGSTNNMRSLRSVPANNEGPRILNLRAVSLREHTRLAEHITAFDFDDEDSITGYQISGGADQELFSISSAGILAMTITPDFEVPTDAGMDNAYEVQVRATSGSGERERSATADFTITVTDVEAEAEKVLVSNTGKTVRGKATVNNSDSAVRIYTGSNSEGYVIHSVALAMAEALEDPSGLKVSLWSNHRPGRWDRPKEEIFAFTNPPSIEARLTEFTAPSDSILDPSTAYWVMIERTGDYPIKFLDTRSDAEDSISEPDWNIGSLRFHRPRHINGEWAYRRVDDDKDQLMLRVIGFQQSGE